MERAWAFYRRSTDKQELSIEDQRKACQKRAAEMGCEIIKEFVPPKGYASGLSIEKDESFRNMVRLAESGTHGAKYLLIYDVSRFGRLPPKAKFYWEEHFRRCGIQIVYTAEHFNYDGSLGDEIQHVIWAPGDPKEIELVRRFFESYAKGNGLGTIVNELNGDGIPSPYKGTGQRRPCSACLRIQPMLASGFISGTTIMTEAQARRNGFDPKRNG